MLPCLSGVIKVILNMKCYILLFTIILFILSASSCSAPSVIADSALDEAASMQKNSSADSGTQLAVQCESSAPTLEFCVAYNFPIVYNGMLLGGSNNQQWIKASEIANDIIGGEIYQLFDMSNYVGLGIGSAIFEQVDGQPSVETIEVMYVVNPYYKLAISAQWDIMPRSISYTSNIDSVKSMLLDYLCKQGLSSPEVEILQCYSVDLLGNGEKMIIVSASSPNRDFYEMFYGDFSIAAIIDSKGSMSILFEDICYRDCDFSEHTRYLVEISSIADLNGDGAMEVMIGWSYYEGYGYDIFSLSDNIVSLVLSNMWGV